MRARVWLVAGALVVLAACATTPPKKPAVVIDKSRQSEHAYAKSVVQCQAQTDEEFCHVVERGDSLYSISRRYGLKVVEIASRNKIEAPYIIRPKDLLVVRLGSPSPSTPPPQVRIQQPVAIATKPVEPTNRTTQNTATRAQPRKPSTTSAARPRPTTPAAQKPATPSTAKPTVKTPPKPMPKRVATPVKTMPQSTPTKTNWRWPVPYKPLPSSNETGLDYRLPDGTKIVAATKGKVIYAGAGLNKYRHLIIVDSQTSYLVAYEFNTSHSIKEGQNLSSGETIANLAPDASSEGSAGDRYQLFHFEVWRNGKALNPQRVIAR